MSHVRSHRAQGHLGALSRREGEDRSRDVPHKEGNAEKRIRKQRLKETETKDRRFDNMALPSGWPLDPDMAPPTAQKLWSLVWGRWRPWWHRLFR